MTDTVLARLAALKTTPTPDLKQQWRDLFETEPPPYNRRFLESRLAYRIQELAYGGLKPETIERLEALAEQFDGGDPAKRKLPMDDRPIAGTRLIREWHGVEHCVTVRDNDYEYQGRPYKSLSAVARAIAGTRWNGWVFFGLKNQPDSVMKKPVIIKRRCAVYTRKSSEEGLDMEFNSLDAQREACESFVASQKQEGWLLVTDSYDDGGFSGGTLERPALQRLLADIEAGRVDIIVVYKIDRLSRSLMDFAKLVEVFDRKGVTFVAVTQSFNTTTSMGRLTLNILLSFAQFEREVIGERIRDKVAASRKKGMWMGGWAPLGYDVKDRKLVVNETEAAVVRRIFDRFAKFGSVTTIARELTAEGFVNKYGQRLDKGRIYKLLNNRVYVGDAVHKGVAYPGEHDAIVSTPLWEKVHAVLAESPRARAGKSRAQTPALLKGLIFGPTGRAMSPTHTRKGQKLYRYYVSQTTLKNGAGSCPVSRIPAGEIEQAVIDQLRSLLLSPEVIVATWRAARKAVPDLRETDVREALIRFDPLWGELFPAEQARIVHLLVDRVDVGASGLDIRLKVDGLGRLLSELHLGNQREAA